MTIHTTSSKKKWKHCGKMCRLIESIYAASALLIFKPVYRIPRLSYLIYFQVHYLYPLYFVELLILLSSLIY